MDMANIISDLFSNIDGEIRLIVWKNKSKQKLSEILDGETWSQTEDKTMKMYRNINDIIKLKNSLSLN